MTKTSQSLLRQNLATMISIPSINPFGCSDHNKPAEAAMAAEAEAAAAAAAEEQAAAESAADEAPSEALAEEGKE